MAARGQKESKEEEDNQEKEEGFQEEGFEEEGFKAQEPSASPLGAIVLAFRVGCHMSCPPFFYSLREWIPAALKVYAVSQSAPNAWDCRTSSQS